MHRGGHILPLRSRWEGPGCSSRASSGADRALGPAWGGCPPSGGTVHSSRRQTCRCFEIPTPPHTEVPSSSGQHRSAWFGEEIANNVRPHREWASPNSVASLTGLPLRSSTLSPAGLLAALLSHMPRWAGVGRSGTWRGSLLQPGPQFPQLLESSNGPRVMSAPLENLSPAWGLPPRKPSRSNALLPPPPDLRALADPPKSIWGPQGRQARSLGVQASTQTPPKPPRLHTRHTSGHSLA